MGTKIGQPKRQSSRRPTISACAIRTNHAAVLGQACTKMADFRMFLERFQEKWSRFSVRNLLHGIPFSPKVVGGMTGTILRMWCVEELCRLSITQVSY